MYTELMEAIKTHLETTVNAAPIQVGYYGDMLQVDLRKTAVLLEPTSHPGGSLKDTRWKSSEFRIRLWILVGMARDYMASMKEMEDVLAADGENIDGIQSALLKLRRDETFSGMSGSMGGKAWRIRSGVLEIGDARLGITQRGSERVNTAQVEIVVLLDIEK